MDFVQHIVWDLYNTYRSISLSKVGPKAHNSTPIQGTTKVQGGKLSEYIVDTDKKPSPIKQLSENKALTSCSASQLAKLIQERKVSASEVLEAHITRAERYNPKIGAVVYFDLERARQKAKEADEAISKGERWGPLHGVPMTVKDTWDVEGMRTTTGLFWLKGNISKQDAVVVRHLKEAGAIIWGKTNLPFSSYDWQCNNNPIFPRCNNPWSLDRTCGGSSGGSAASLAAGFSPLELGSDVAGSIRQPSHCCGIFGLRTTEGLLPYEGHAHVPGSPYTLKNLMSLGPMARHPEDLELFLELFAGSRPQERLLQAHKTPKKALSDLRIAWTSHFDEQHTCSETKKLLEQFIQACKQSGAQVKEVEPPYPMREALYTWGLLQGFEFNAASPFILRTVLGRWFMRLVGMPMFLGRGDYVKGVGKGMTASIPQYFDALHKREGIKQRLRDFFQEWDFWLTPSAVTSAFRHCRTGAKIPVEGTLRPYTTLASLYNCSTALGAHPILSMPVGRTQEGLPIGIQIHSDYYHDFQIVHFAKAISAYIPSIGMPELEQTTSVL